MKTIYNIYNLKHNFCPLCDGSMTRYRSGYACRKYVKLSNRSSHNIESYVDDNEIWIAIPGLIYNHKLSNRYSNKESIVAIAYQDDKYETLFNIDEPILDLKKIEYKIKTRLLFT